MKVLTAEQMREVDRLTTERYGVPSLQLMENAGEAVAECVVAACGDIKAWVLVLCGKGNNGGDGFVAARKLRERGISTRVFLFAEPSTIRGDAAANLKRWRDAGGDLAIVTDAAAWERARAALNETDVVVDALLGTGLAGPVTGLLALVIEDVNRIAEDSLRSRRPRVVSVDMPSGLASDGQDFAGPVVMAGTTVTFTAPKVGQLVAPLADHVGRLIVRGIGTPPELVEGVSSKLWWLEPEEFRDMPLVRKRDAHKGSFGHVLVVAGSVGKSGAAALAGRAALRVGAGLVTVATVRDVLPIVAGSMSELMTAPLLCTEAGTVSMANLDYGRFEAIARDKSVLAIGPGLSMEPETQQFVRTVVTRSELPVILDADGLNAFAETPDELVTRATSFLAVTPHPGEMARLTGMRTAELQRRRLDVALEYAAKWRAYVVLKGFHTILATPDGRAFINTTGNPGMAKGGTGDALTGILAGLVAQFGSGRAGSEQAGTAQSGTTQAGPTRSSAVQAERVLGLGIYLHGVAGDLAAAQVGEASLLASELIDAIPAAFAKLIAERDRACE